MSDGGGEITIILTKKQARKMGLLICQCGHYSNNHFDDYENPTKKNQCAHCDCVGYREVAVVGRLVTA